MRECAYVAIVVVLISLDYIRLVEIRHHKVKIKQQVRSFPLSGDVGAHTQVNGVIALESMWKAISGEHPAPFRP